jgi:drug/metabolite transporter (DMT)-like permease
MSLWLILVIVAQVLLAVVALIDKYIVSSDTVVLRPFTYTFWISILSSGSALVFLFSWISLPVEGIHIPSLANVEKLTLITFTLALAAGYTFFTALLSMFTALKYSDASDVVPVVGAVNALATFFLGYYFFETSLPQNFLFGMLLLVLGTVFTSRMRFSRQTTLSTLHAGVMFGLHYVVLKELFTLTNFDTGFFWSRMAIVAIALSMLLIPYYYEKVMIRTQRAKQRDGTFLIGNKLLGGLASILMLMAVDLVDKSLVSIPQALGGLQYLFLLTFSACCGRYISKDWGENVTKRDIIQKTISIPLIVIGFFLLFL